MVMSYNGTESPNSSLPGVMTEPSKRTILVIEDEPGPRDALKVILRPFYNVHIAAQGETALQILNDQPIDLITLDQKLPDCQGIDLLREIKLKYPHVEVIIITGYGSLKSAMDGIRHGAAGYLLKPFNVTELISLINQSLEKKGRLDCLRDFLKVASDLWDNDEQMDQLWPQVREQYAGLTQTGPEPQPQLGTHPGSIALLSDLLEAKDRQLFNHCSRVSFYSTLLANPMNLNHTEQRILGLGAFLHDIGYIGLEGRLAPQTEALSERDREATKWHTELGARMIQPFGFPAEVGQVITYHHERHDGSGYPYGLRGEGIPLFARIVAIAQTFDSLITGRGGRPPITVEDALKRISAEAGTEFDPSLTTVFAKVVNDCQGSLPTMAMLPNQAPMQDIPGESGAS